MITMGNAGVNTPATSEPTTGPGVSFVELWDGASEIVWHHQRGSHPGTAAQAVRVDRETALTRMVLPHQAQKRDASPSGK